MNTKYVDEAMAQIQALLKIPSPTGFTREAVEYLVGELSGMGFRPVVTKKGSVMCRLADGEQPLLISAHVDTLGAMVRSIKSNGRLRYTHIGGYQDATVETENCLVHTRDGKSYSGTVQSVSASQHVYSGMGDKPRNDETLEIVLDEQVRTAEDVRALGIQNGCFISWDPRVRLTASGYLKSRHLDDKAASGVLLALARAVADGEVKPARGVDIMFTVYEEVGHGASSLANLDYEEILSVDMGCVGDDLACDETMVSICCKDSSGPYNYDMTCRLIDLAEKQGLRYATDIYPSYSSDASAAMCGGLEARHALIGPGVFASHGYERIHRLGVENTLLLVSSFVQAPVE